jgi:glycosyltransferase involved in cell wall biosynthesis
MRDKDLCHAVGFTGALAPEGEMTALYQSADVICVPSRNEPFGIVVIEAWAAGKPVIATRNGGPRDFVSHGEDGLLVNDDSFAICTAVWDLFADFDHARRMGERGHTKAVTGFGWDLIAAQTETVYQEIA